MMKTKTIVFLLVLSMMFQSICVTASVRSTDDKYAYIDFGTQGAVQRLNAWMAITPEVETRSGKSAWKIIGSSTDKGSIYIDVLDGFMNKLCGESVYVEVEYFDEGKGVFVVEYDSEDRSDAHTEFVDMQGTLTWKKHTFFLQDAYFDNRLKDADLRIGSTSLSLGNGGTILIGSVKIYRGDKKSPVDITALTKVPGNIFLEGENIEFDIKYRNRTKERYNYTLRYTAVNMENDVLWTKEEPISFSALEEIDKSVSFLMPEFGLHWLRIELIDEKGESYCIKDAEFSYITSGRLNPRSGTSTHTDMILNRYGDEKEVHRILAGAGYGNIRMGWTWAGRYEQVPNSYTMQPHWKEQFELYKAKGVKIIVIASLGNSTLYGDIQGHKQGELSQGYKEKLDQQTRAMVRDSKKYAEAYIIGNEPEHPSEWTVEQRKPEYYVQRMEIIYNAIKDEYPEALVVGLAPTMTNIQWIKDVFSLGAGKYMDAATMHPYAAHKTLENSGFVGRMQEIRQIADENGCEDLPIWITENGWAKGRDGLGHIDLYTESQQLVRMNVYSEVYDLADRVVDYLLTSSNSGGTQKSLGYGHIAPPPNATTDIDLPYGAHRSYATIAAWNKNFGGTGTVTKCFDDEKSNIRAYVFKRNNKNERFITMWSDEGRDNVTFDLGCESVELMDCFGNTDTVYGIDGKYTFNLDGDPTYVIGAFDKCEMLNENLFSPSKITSEAIRDTESSFSITAPVPDGYSVVVANYGDADAKETVFKNGKAEITYTLTDRTRVPADDYLVGNPGRSQQLNKPINEIKDYSVLSIMNGGKLYYRMKLPITEISPVVLESRFYPYSREFLGNWIVEFDVTNKSENKIDDISLSITSPDIWARQAKSAALALNPGETKTHIMSVPKNALSEKFLLGAEVKDAQGIQLSVMQKEYATSCAVYTDIPPTIDGVLNEWYEGSALTVKSDSYASTIKTEPFNGAADLSAKLMFQWDDDNLYFAARVTDDIHRQAYHDSQTWKADGFQIGFDILESDTAFSHVMLALGDDGYNTLWLFASEDSSNPKGVIEGGEAKYIREGNLTVYEAKIPLSAIMPLKNAVAIGDGQNASGVVSSSDDRYKPENGMIIKFSALINDDDGVGRKGYIQYGKGVSESTTAQFAGLYFLK